MSILIIFGLILLACVVTIAYLWTMAMLSLSNKVSTGKFTIIGSILSFLFIVALVAIAKAQIPVV